MAQMATIVRNTCRTPRAGADAPTFELLTTATAHQQRALALIQAIQAYSETETRNPSQVADRKWEFGLEAVELQISAVGCRKVIDTFRSAGLFWVFQSVLS